MPTNVLLTAKTQRRLAEASNGYLVYMLHFEKPLVSQGRKIKHYIGITNFIERRMQEHRIGPPRGQRLVQLAMLAGPVVLVEVWTNSRVRCFERYLKNLKQASRFCSLCRYDNGKSILDNNKRMYERYIQALQGEENETVYFERSKAERLAQ